MRRLIVLIVVCLVTLPALCQSAAKWQIGSIIEVKPRPVAGENASDPMTYEISLKVGGTIYVVRFTTPAGEVPPKYFAGRDLLVSVGKDAITYNDILGRSFKAPIESERPATESKRSK